MRSGSSTKGITHMQRPWAESPRPSGLPLSALPVMAMATLFEDEHVLGRSTMALVAAALAMTVAIMPAAAVLLAMSGTLLNGGVIKAHVFAGLRDLLGDAKKML